MHKIDKLNSINVNCKLLYEHFSIDHDLEEDLRFQIFASNIVEFRKRFETDLMNVLNTLHPSGLNSASSFVLNSIKNYQIPPLISEKI